MMPRRRFRPEWMLAVALALVPLASAQQEPNQPGPAAEARGQDEEEPLFSIQITPHMLYNGLDRLVEKRLARDYDLDEFQKEEMRRVLHEHVPRFLKEHRHELERIWVEWVEAISGDEPPDPEYVAEWARRFLPIVEDAQGVLDAVSGDMRGFLDDRQQVLLDGYLAAWNVGSQFLTNRLREFEAGGFVPERDWPGYKEVRHRSPEEVQRIVAQAEREREIAMASSARVLGAAKRNRIQPSETGHGRRAGPQDATPDGKALAGDAQTGKLQSTTQQAKDEWDRYVEDFIRRYKLDDEQKQRAENLLAQQKSRRGSYFARKSADIEALKRMYEEAKGDQKKIALAESRYQKLYEPVDRMFEQLKQKLDKLPTRAQRKAAAELENKEQPKLDVAPKRGARDRQP